jgi:hypothetical protein
MNQEEYKTQKAQYYSDAQRYAKEWGITPGYYLSVHPFFFHLYGHVQDVPGLVKACYKWDSENGWFTFEPETLLVADHPEAGVELFERCTNV